MRSEIVGRDDVRHGEGLEALELGLRLIDRRRRGRRRRRHLLRELDHLDLVHRRDPAAPG